MMNNKVRRIAVCFAGLIALLYTGCDNLMQNTASLDGGASITISCGTKTFRTCKPTADETALNSYTYSLTGTIGESTTTFFTKDTYANLTKTDAIKVSLGTWSFSLTVYNGDTEMYADTESTTIYSGSNGLSFVLNPATGGTGSVSLTLKYPTGKGVSKVTAKRYTDPAGTDEVGYSGTGLDITTAATGETQDSVTYTESGIASGDAGFVRFYYYDTNGVNLGSTMEGVSIVSGLTSTETISVDKVNMFDVAVYYMTIDYQQNYTMLANSGKTVVLKRYDSSSAAAVQGAVPTATYTLTDDGGIFSASVPKGYYTVHMGTSEDDAKSSTANSNMTVPRSLRIPLFVYNIKFDQSNGVTISNVTKNGSSVTLNDSILSVETGDDIEFVGTINSDYGVCTYHPAQWSTGDKLYAYKAYENTAQGTGGSSKLRPSSSEGSAYTFEITDIDKSYLVEFANISKPTTIMLTLDGSPWSAKGRKILFASYNKTLYSGNSSQDYFDGAEFTETSTTGTYTAYIGVSNGYYFEMYNEASKQIYVDKSTAYYIYAPETCDPLTKNFYSITFEQDDGSHFASPVADPVPEGCSYSFTVTPCDGYSGTVSTVTANGITITDDDNDGYYTITSIHDPQVIKVTGSTTKLPSYTVTFEPNCDNSSPDSSYTQTFSEGVAQCLWSNRFTNEDGGYSFKSWNTKSDGLGTSYTDKQKVTMTGDVTLYAIWE